MQRIFFSLAIIFAVVGCSNGHKNDKTDVDKTNSENKVEASDPNVIKIYVDEKGLITSNGNSISLEELDSSLSKLMTNKGSVYYSRANGQGEPPPGAMKVIDLVIKYSLPIRMYTDKTFTEVVKPD